MAKDINIDIDKNGLSDTLGSNLEKVSSMPKLDGTSIAALGLSLTGSQGLYSAASMTEQFSLDATDSLMDLQTMVFDYAYNELENALSENGIIKSIQDTVEVSSKTLALAKEGLKYVNSGASIAANIAKMADTLCAISDPDVTVVPSVKEACSIVGASLMAIINSKFEEAYQQLVELYNSMICTSASSVTDNVIASINGILDTTEPLIDQYMEKYTGYTVSEVRYVCNTGFALVNMLKRYGSYAKQELDEKKAKKAAAKSAQNISENINDVSSAIDNQAKDYADKLSQDFSKDQIKAKLVEWMNVQSFGLRNAFHLMMIKDCIEDIKLTCQQLTNQTIENLADFVNSTQIVFQIFDLIGYQYGKEGITIDDLKLLGEVLKYTALDTGQDITNQIRVYSKKMREYGANVANKANSEVSTITSNAQNYSASISDYSKNIVDNAVNAEDENNYLNNSNNQSDESTDEDITAYDILDTSINGKTTTINIKLYVEPTSSDDIKAYVSNFSYNDHKVFNAANRRKLKTAFEDAWVDNEDVTETIKVKVSGVSRTYIFVITPDKEKYKNNNVVATDNYQIIDNQTSKASFSEPSQILNSVSININMAYIEAAFADKVLIFDPIVKMLDMMNPLIKILQTLCHLVENYQINTEFVRSKKQASLANALRTSATVYNGLKNVKNLEDTNFFTIRTNGLALWAIKELNAIPDENGFAVVETAQTIKLYGYCTLHDIIPEEPINLLKGTTLYFDGTGIKDGDKLDGTTNGLERIQVNKDNGEVYFDSSNRSMFASQILQANGSGKDPYYNIDISNQVTEESDSKFSDLFKSIIIDTDESEGTNVISLDNISCCQKVDVSEESEETENVVVVEFGQEYTKGEAVDFTVNVKPGDSINKDTILAYIHKDNQNIPVKSIYGSGTVLGINSDSDYLHIYPQNANRHIVIADASIAEPDFSIDDISTLQNKMKDSTEMYQMIISLLLPSMYPIMLQNANRGHKISVSEVANTFSTVIEKYNDQIADRAEDLKNLSGEDSINACSDDANKLVKIKDQMLEIRNVSMYKDILYYYNGTETQLKSLKYSCNTPLSSCNIVGSYDYADCMGLAYETPDYKSADIAKDSFGDDINTDLNQNYYVTLLSKITTRTGNKFAQDYFNLIKNIIDNRLTEESTNIGVVKTQFNKLYKCGINETEEDGFGLVNGYDEFKDIDITDKDAINNLITFLKHEYIKYLICKESSPMLEYNPVSKLKSQYLSLQSLADAGESQKSQLNDLYDKAEQTLTNEDNIETYGQKLNILTSQLANIYIYVLTTEANNKSKYPGPAVKRIDNNGDSLTRRLSTYKWATERWITNNNGIITNIKYPYSNKTYLTFIEWLIDVYNEASRRHNDYNAVDSLYIKDINKEVKNQIVKIIFNNSEPDNLDSIYNNVMTPYRKQNSSEELIENDNKDVNQILNEYYFDLTCKEADKIHAFWKDILEKYGTTNIGDPEGPWGEYNYKTVEKEIQDYANNLNSYAQWPQAMQIEAGKYKCTLYTFVNRDVEKASIPNVDINATDYDTNIPDAVIDYSQSSDLLEPKEGDITILDYEYWLVYMLNATLVTLTPTYWADGFDIPPLMTPTLMPAIYVPIAKPILIPFINVLIVFGISIRGIWPMPIVLMVNMNNHDLNAMLPFMVALELSRDMFARAMEKTENIIPETINKYLDKASAEDADFKKTLDKFRTYAAVIRSMPMENKAIIEEEFYNAIYEQQEVLADERAERKAKREQKKRDKRQVITREEDLGEGDEPM